MDRREHEDPGFRDRANLPMQQTARDDRFGLLNPISGSRSGEFQVKPEVTQLTPDNGITALKQGLSF